MTYHDMEVFFEKMSRSLVNSLRGPSSEVAAPARSRSPSSASCYSDDIDSELPLSGIGLSARPSVLVDAAPSIFGVNVNEPLHPETVSVDVHPLPVSEVAPQDVPVSAPAPAEPAPVPDQCAQVSPAVVAPDADLPLDSAKRPPTNWHPHPAVLSWAAIVVDQCEWSEPDRVALSKEFSPDPLYDHLFTAVPTPPGLLKAIKDPITWERDYLFKRAEAERLLHEANMDLTSGLRPLIEVLSSLKGVAGMEGNRTLLARVF